MTTQTWETLTPERVSEWRDMDGGQVDLLVPPYGRGRFGRKLEKWLKAEPHTVHLDDVGSFVWHRCDGATRVGEIADAMHAHFGEQVEPVQDRLVLFLQQLVRGRFISV